MPDPAGAAEEARLPGHLGPDLEYKHDELSLDEESIRILRVLPHEGNETISCKLCTTTIRDSFSALSYVWGPPQPRRRILINGKGFLIGQNLYRFLEVASAQYPGLDIWIDAVCIDQINNVEKSHQVLQMGKIYSAARKVLIWLGHDTALESWFRAINGYASKDVSGGPLHMLLGRKAWYQGFERLMQHAYWSRLWITQELLLSQCISMMVGSVNVTLQTFRHQYRLCREDLRVLYNRGQDERIFMLLSQRYERKRGISLHSRSLHDAARLMMHTSCLDPRDRVFGFLSLVQDGGSFPVSYDDSKALVFMKALVHFNTSDSIGVLMRNLYEDYESIAKQLYSDASSDTEICFRGTRLWPLSRKPSSSGSICGGCITALPYWQAVEVDLVWCLRMLPEDQGDGRTSRGCSHIVFQRTSKGAIYRAVRSCQGCRSYILKRISAILFRRESDRKGQETPATQESTIFARTTVPSPPGSSDAMEVTVTMPLKALVDMVCCAMDPDRLCYDEPLLQNSGIGTK